MFDQFRTSCAHARNRGLSQACGLAAAAATVGQPVQECIDLVKLTFVCALLWRLWNANRNKVHTFFWILFSGKKVTFCVNKAHLDNILLKWRLTFNECKSTQKNNWHLLCLEEVAYKQRNNMVRYGPQKYVY